MVVPCLRRLLPVTAEARVRSQVNPCEICGGESDTGTGLYTNILFFPVNTVPLMLHFHFPLRVALTRRTNGQRLEPSTKECSFGNWKAVDWRKYCES